MAKLPLTRSVTVFVLLMMLTSCSTQSPVDQQVKELQTVQSWAATAHMASDAWTNNTVPTAYTKRTLQTAQQSIQDSLDTLTQKASAPAPILADVRTVAQVVGEMGAAVERGDRAALQQQTAQLAAQEQTLGTLAKQVEGQQ